MEWAQTQGKQSVGQPGEGRLPMPNNGVTTHKRPWIAIFSLIALGMLIGAGGIIASIEINRATSSDAFCTSCHTMAIVAADPQFQKSPHRANPVGVVAGCSDCHIPTNNWFNETYIHLVSGIRDVIAEKVGNFSDPAVWNARRIELAKTSRDIMRRNRGVTCRKCHEVSAIRAPEGAHAPLAQGQMNCVDCHSVHVQSAAPPKQ